MKKLPIVPSYNVKFPSFIVLGIRGTKDSFISIRPILDDNTGVVMHSGNYVEPVYSTCSTEIENSVKAATYFSVVEIVNLISKFNLQFKSFLNINNLTHEDLVFIKIDNKIENTNITLSLNDFIHQ